MSSQVFYRKWRPQTLAEVVGQQPVTQTLLNALASGRISHAYLFCGPRGTGKTSTARILAKAVNCLTNGNGEPCNTCDMCRAIAELRALDVIEIDAATNTHAEDIRTLREKVNYLPNQARFKVYIIDEVHMLSNAASNALLKTLEEPPPHVIFILATTEAHKILPTIISRCQRFDFRRHSQANLIAYLTHVCQGENIKIDNESLRLIARSATGSQRDAVNLLEQLTAYYGSEIGLQQVQAMLGITGDWRVKELVKHIINKDMSAGMATIASINNDGLDLKQFSRELVEYLRWLLLIKSGSNDVDLPAEDITEMKNLVSGASLDQILRAVKLFGQSQPGFDNYPTLPLELALVDSILIPEETPISRERPVQATSQFPKSASSPAAKSPAPSRAEKPVSSAAEKHPQPQPVAAAASVEARPQPPKAAPHPAPLAAREPAPASVTSPLEGATEVDRLRLNWRQVIEQAPPDTKRTAAIAILRSAGVQPTAVENGTVVLSFRSDIHKANIEKAENKVVAEKIISNFLGHSCRISCVVDDNNHLLKAALKMGAQRIDTEER